LLKVKEGFTLIETILSFVLLSIMIAGLLKLFGNNNISYEIYNDLQKIENKYNTSGIIENSENILFETNSLQ
jgi:Tfp pilus assembly protein PilV